MRIMKTCALGLVFCLSAMPALAATGEIARVVAMTPYAEAEGPSGLRELALKTPIFESDEVRTGEKGMVQLIFNDDTTMTLDAGSVVAMTDFGYGQGEEPAFAVDMSLGLMRMITGEVVSGDPEAFSVKTPHGTIGIRGTGFSVAVSPDNTLVTAFQLTDGREILVKNDFTGEMTQLKTTSMAVIVGPEGSQLIPLPDLPAVDSQFIARPSLSGIQNGANPDDGLGGSDREDSLLDFGQIAVPGMGQNGDEGSGSGTPDEPTAPDEPTIPDEPATPTFTSATVTVPLDGYSTFKTSEDRWSGELSFDADLATGDASNAAFSLSGSSSEDRVSGTDGVFNAEKTDLQNGTFSVEFAQLEGAFADVQGGVYDVTSGNAVIDGTADLTDAETTGKGSGTMTGLNVLIDHATDTAVTSQVIMPYFSAQVTGDLSATSDVWDANQNQSTWSWTGELTFDANLDNGMVSNASFFMDGVAEDGTSVGRVEGMDGMAMLDQPSMTEFALGGFTLSGTAVDANNPDSTADFSGEMELDEATRTGTADVLNLNVGFGHTSGNYITINMGS